MEAAGGAWSRTTSLKIDALIAVESACARPRKGGYPGRLRMNRRPSPSKTRALPQLYPIAVDARP